MTHCDKPRCAEPVVALCVVCHGYACATHQPDHAGFAKPLSKGTAEHIKTTETPQASQTLGGLNSTSAQDVRPADGLCGALRQRAAVRATSAKARRAGGRP